MLFQKKYWPIIPNIQTITLPVVCVTASTIPITLFFCITKQVSNIRKNIIFFWCWQKAFSMHSGYRRWSLTSIGLGSNESTTPAISVILCIKHHQPVTQFLDT
jgi:hypothetical protein